MDNRGYPIVRGCRLTESHPGMETFSKMPRIGIPQKYQFYGLGVFFLTFLVLSPFLSFGVRYQLLPALLVFVAISAMCLIITFLAARAMAGSAQVKQALEDAKTFDAKSYEQHVGVAYCDYIWAFKNETSWDRGFISFAGGLLCFRGFGPIFRLPGSAIERVWIAVPTTGTHKLPRVYVEWNHPTSDKNVLSFEIRGTVNLDEACEEAEKLASWLKNLPRSEPEHQNLIVLPFESKSLNFAKDPARQIIEKKDIAIAWTVAFLLFAVLETITFTVRHYYKFDSGIVWAFLGMFVLYVYSEIIRARVIAKAK